MSTDPELIAAIGPETGEDLIDHNEIADEADRPVTNDVHEPPGQQPASKRAGSPSHKRKAKSTSHRNYRSHADRLVLPVYTKPMGPRELHPRERLDYNKVNKGEYANIRTISGVKAYYEFPDLTEAEIVDLASIMARDLKRLEVDDSSPQAIIESTVARIHRISALLERYVPVEDIVDNSISVGKALNIDAAMGNNKFEHSIKAEVLITKTRTLEAITHTEVKALPEHTFIHTVVKCKRKHNPDGTYDKHKARTAAREDEYLRKLLARGRPPPASFSPTINTLTFQFVLQVATSKNLHRATQDIKYAYLNAPLPDDMEPLITKLDDNIADICGFPRGQLYRICKALYAPASGRLWHEHYTNSLKKEGYTQSKFDLCLFFRVNESEVTYICLFVDDNYVFSNKTDHMTTFVTSMQKYYQVTLDDKADSFLGIQTQTAATGSTRPLVPLYNSTVRLMHHTSFIPTPRDRPVLYKGGTFYNRSAKQALVSTSSTQSEMRAIFTLVLNLLFLFSICLDLNLAIQLSAIVMEDNSAVITITTDDQAYLKKCKHFLMVINYIREQVDLGLIDIQKIAGEDNLADLHTKPLRFAILLTRGYLAVVQRLSYTLGGAETEATNEICRKKSSQDSATADIQQPRQ
eukprot:gene35206-biopygen27828